MEHNLCYKAFSNNELVEKHYQYDGDLQSISDGIRYAKKLEDVVLPLDAATSYSIYVCEHGKNEVSEGKIHASDSLDVIRVVPISEIISYCKANLIRLEKTSKLFLIRYHVYGKFAYAKDTETLRLIARYGTHQDAKKLMDSRLPGVRQEIAARGEKEFLDVLVKDKNYLVREVVAKTGIEEYVQRLAKDPCVNVRLACVENASIKVLAFLSHDDCADVRLAVVQQSNEFLLERLAEDKDNRVRKFAKYRYDIVKNSYEKDF